MHRFNFSPEFASFAYTFCFARQDLRYCRLQPPRLALPARPPLRVSHRRHLQHLLIRRFSSHPRVFQLWLSHRHTIRSRHSLKLRLHASLVCSQARLMSQWMYVATVPALLHFLFKFLFHIFSLLMHVYVLLSQPRTLYAIDPIVCSYRYCDFQSECTNDSSLSVSIVSFNIHMIDCQ